MGAAGCCAVFSTRCTAREAESSATFSIDLVVGGVGCATGATAGAAGRGAPTATGLATAALGGSGRPARGVAAVMGRVVPALGARFSGFEGLAAVIAVRSDSVAIAISYVSTRHERSLPDEGE
jgi:hypothetical protein